MLLIALGVLAVLWLAVTVIVVGLCASAAAGDRAASRSTSAQPDPARLLRIA
jgi:hypothetical protein